MCRRCVLPIGTCVFTASLMIFVSVLHQRLHNITIVARYIGIKATRCIMQIATKLIFSAIAVFTV